MAKHKPEADQADTRKEADRQTVAQASPIPQQEDERNQRKLAGVTAPFPILVLEISQRSLVGGDTGIHGPERWSQARPGRSTEDVWNQKGQQMTKRHGRRGDSLKTHLS